MFDHGGGVLDHAVVAVLLASPLVHRITLKFKPDTGFSQGRQFPLEKGLVFFQYALDLPVFPWKKFYLHGKINKQYYSTAHVW